MSHEGEDTVSGVCVLCEGEILWVVLCEGDTVGYYCVCIV